MWRRLLAGALVAAMWVAAGCAPGGGESGKADTRPVEGGSLTLGLTGAPSGLFHPYLSTDRDDQLVIRLVYRGLLKQDAALAWVCDLCEQYTVSPDQRTVTFTLRQDVHWHDGLPVTAEDVAFTFRQLLDPGYSGPGAGGLSALVGVQDVLDQRDLLAREVAAGRLPEEQARPKAEAGWRYWLEGAGRQAIAVTDSRTVSFTMAEPYAPLLSALAGPVLPAHIWQGLSWEAAAAHAAARQPVGTGPYRFVSFQAGQGVRLVRHETFHGGKPWVPDVVLRPVAPGEAARDLQEGRLDWAPLQPAEAAQLADTAGVKLLSRPGAGYQYLGLVQERGPFADRRVRQALLYGINRADLVAQVLGGHGTVLNTHMHPAAWAHDPAGLEPYAYDPARAAALLAEAGWGELSPSGYRTREGQVLGFTLKYPAGNQAREATAAQIQQDLKKIGVKVTLEKVDFTQLVREVFGERKAEAWLLGWELPPDPAPGPQFQAGNKWGAATGWVNTRSEELIQQGIRTVTSEGRKSVYTEWAALANAELPFLFLYAENEVEGIRADRVRGWPATRPLDAIEAWWVPQAVGKGS